MRGSIVKRFPGPVIDEINRPSQGLRLHNLEICALGKELSEQSIRMLIQASFPRMIGIGKETPEPQGCCQLLMTTELFAIVKGHRVPEGRGHRLKEPEGDLIDLLNVLIPREACQQEL